MMCIWSMDIYLYACYVGVIPYTHVHAYCPTKISDRGWLIITSSFTRFTCFSY